MGGRRWRRFDTVLACIAVALAYYGSARLGLRLALVGEVVTPLWPPTGVAVVALVVWGYWVWPAIAVAAFAVNASITEPAGVAAAIAVGNTLAPLAAAWLLRRYAIDPKLERLRDAVGVVLIALGAMMISASLGTLTLAVASGSGAGSVRTWWVWWTGDAMGVLIVAPVLWTLARTRFGPPNWARIGEAVVLFSGLTASAVIAARSHDSLLFLVLPFLAWIAWRFQQLGAAPAGLVASFAIVTAAAGNHGLFAGMDLVERMVVLQLFNACVALTSFVFAAAVTERRQILEELFEREHRIAVALQRSMLPDGLPVVAGLALAARYQPSTVESRIGGDWYDVIPLGGDRMGIAVGDVAGHGVPAAATMAQLRMGLRAHALTRGGPGRTVSLVNRLVTELYPGTMATLLYAELDLGTGALRYVNAGHVPPLLLPDGGVSRYLEAPAGLPLGVGNVPHEEATEQIPDDATLLVFTDGLIERRHEGLDAGLYRLQRASTSGPTDVDGLCDHILATMVASAPEDDVALLALRATSLAGLTLRVRVPATPVAVAETRHVLKRWLEQNGAADDETFDILVACSEAQTNVVRHAYKQGDGVVDIEASVDGRDVTITVRDQGSWREPIDAGSEERGRGVAIIRMLSEAEFATDASGTEVRISRRLSGAITSSPQS